MFIVDAMRCSEERAPIPDVTTKIKKEEGILLRIHIILIQLCFTLAVNYLKPSALFLT